MASSRVREDGDTATRILDSAESLVQVRGFNGFSYADVRRRSTRGGPPDRERTRGGDARGAPLRRRRALRGRCRPPARRIPDDAVSDKTAGAASHYGSYYGNFAADAYAEIRREEYGE